MILWLQRWQPRAGPSIGIKSCLLDTVWRVKTRQSTAKWRKSWRRQNVTPSICQENSTTGMCAVSKTRIPFGPTSLEPPGLGSCVLRARRSAKLTHHAQTVKQATELRNLAGRDAVEYETRHFYLLSSRRDPLKFALVATSSGPPLGNSVLFGD